MNREALEGLFNLLKWDEPSRLSASQRVELEKFADQEVAGWYFTTWREADQAWKSGTYEREAANRFKGSGQSK